eukprot:TRINITY_DN2623_c1_g1_i4.p1 TRINITY_DN2623_c1_g1~~TRINITY_DN2623_c1_g1_i4.p1  ORF type:complete len:310 (-),score=22.65 TRINITY_DN2623_c1_g1_i4:378-1307(-)
MPRIPRNSKKNVPTGLKSEKSYKRAWELFSNYRGQESADKIPSPQDFINYFTDERSRGLLASSLWATYSKLNRTLKVEYMISLQQHCPSLTILLKSWGKHELPQQSMSFSSDVVEGFVAGGGGNPVDVLNKAAVSLMYSGGLRGGDATYLLRRDLVEVPGVGYDVSYVRNKTGGSHTFRIKEGTPFYTAVELYLLQRDGSPACNYPRLFLTPRNKTFVSQPVGINRLYALPRRIAFEFNLPNAERYTGHALRRSAAQHLVELGTGDTAMRNHMGWTSSRMIDGYVNGSQVRREDISQRMASVVKQEDTL